MASMPPPPHSHYQQDGPLDIALLHSKLDSHLRQQELLLANRERRASLKKGIYIPRSAATHFTITTTPAAAAQHTSSFWNPGLQRRASMPVISTNITGKDDLTARNLETLPNMEERMKSLRLLEQIDSAQTSPRPDTPAGNHYHHPQQQQESAGKPSNHDLLSSTNTTTVKAAKRQTITGYPPASSSSRPIDSKRLSSFHPALITPPPPLTNCRPPMGQEISSSSRRKSETAPTNTTTNEPHHHQQQRSPNQDLTIYNRPNWTQHSQNGEESTAFLHLPRTTLLRRDAPPAERRKPLHEQQQQQGHHLPEKKQQQQQGHHLVADAVKIIQDQQRSQRKKSLLGFFKKR